jgi:hypothetical protein
MTPPSCPVSVEAVAYPLASGAAIDQYQISPE